MFFLLLLLLFLLLRVLFLVALVQTCATLLEWCNDTCEDLLLYVRFTGARALEATASEHHPTMFIMLKWRTLFVFPWYVLLRLVLLVFNDTLIQPHIESIGFTFYVHANHVELLFTSRNKNRSFMQWNSCVLPQKSFRWKGQGKNTKNKSLVEWLKMDSIGLDEFFFADLKKVQKRHFSKNCDSSF